MEVVNAVDIQCMMIQGWLSKTGHPMTTVCSTNFFFVDVFTWIIQFT